MYILDESQGNTDSILLPGFKLPAILDASRRQSVTPAAGRRSSHSRLMAFSGRKSRSSRKSAMNVRATSPKVESSEEEDEVENALPLVTITRNQSRVGLVSTITNHL